MRLLDRYVLNNFLVPFFYSTVGFLAIWLVFDLKSNADDFFEANVTLKTLAEFYLTQFPQILVLCLPVGLLLALLYSLSRMSRSNEVISMLTAGQSISRILRPLFIFGIFTAVATMALNYSMAPHSDSARKALMDEITKGHPKTDIIERELFRNRQDYRTWLVEQIDPKRNTLRGIDITQQNADGDVLEKWYADRAVFNPQDKSWTFTRGKTVNFDKDGAVLSEDDTWLIGSKRVTGWSETVWRITSTNADPADLSVPELREYLTNNRDFPQVNLAPFETNFWYRFAVPFQCLVVIFIAAPLGIVYSRRGVLAGVASAIFCYAGMMVVEKLFLALGKGDRIAPWVGAWTSNLVFLAVGFYVLWMRANNRDLPSMIPSFKPRPTNRPSSRSTPLPTPGLKPIPEKK